MIPNHDYLRLNPRLYRVLKSVSVAEKKVNQWKNHVFKQIIKKIFVHVDDGQSIMNKAKIKYALKPNMKLDFACRLHLRMKV